MNKEKLYFTFKYAGLGFLVVAILWHTNKGFNYSVLGLYILGGCLFGGYLIYKFGKRR